MSPGRNDPCPCGSGKKYKHCCGLVTRPAKSAPAAPVAGSAGPAAPVRVLNTADIGALIALVEQQRLGEAERRTLALLAQHTDAGILWKILGVALMRQGKDALPALRRTAELMPQDAEAHGNLGAALHDQGHWAQGLASLQRALALQPDNVEALVDAADATRALGGPREAVALYRRALTVQPQLLEARNNLGNAFMELRQFQDAVEQYRLALQVQADGAQIHCNLANALRQLGLLDQALVSSQRAVALDPGLSVAHNTQGLILAALGHYEQALASYRRSLALKADDLETMTNLATLLRDHGQLREALAVYGKAVELQPQRAESHCNLGHALLESRRIDEAASSYVRALSLNPDDAVAHLSLSTVRRLQGRGDDALASCERALALAPDNVEALSLLGELRADRGQFSQAEALFARALAVDPAFPFAYFSIATHRKMSSEDAAWLRGAQALLAKPLPLRHQISLRYALGKYYDDLGQYQEAFGHYRQANELSKRYGNRYEGAKLSRRIDDIIAGFDASGIARLQSGGHASERPVFIVGMPRSGTSLAEQILASHPAVFGAGELIFWQSAFGTFEAAGPGGQAGASLIPAMARSYLERLTALAGDASRVVDKMPANFMAAGLIHAAFPHARIIHMRRHPIDTCLSIYFQYFSQVHPYANDLENLAHYYREYARLTDHWRSSLPATALLEVAYEGLIEDQEGWTRRMLEFIGLPWDPRCLQFQETERVVITTSKWQVRQKIHAASAGRWKHYQPFVAPLHSLVSLSGQPDATAL
jgi:tetratricopeptide (TPR) repeat protein